MRGALCLLFSTSCIECLNSDVQWLEGELGMVTAKEHLCPCSMWSVARCVHSVFERTVLRLASGASGRLPEEAGRVCILAAEPCEAVSMQMRNKDRSHEYGQFVWTH